MSHAQLDEIAEEVDVSASTVRNRIDRLEEAAAFNRMRGVEFPVLRPS
jgi:DNA-binding Lrp family transcriptional regulator